MEIPNKSALTIFWIRTRTYWIRKQVRYILKILNSRTLYVLNLTLFQYSDLWTNLKLCNISNIYSTALLKKYSIVLQRQMFDVSTCWTSLRVQLPRPSPRRVGQLPNCICDGLRQSYLALVSVRTEKNRCCGTRYTCTRGNSTAMRTSSYREVTVRNIHGNYTLVHLIVQEIFILRY